MAQYYFFPGVLEIGKEFSLQGAKVARIRETEKPKLAGKLCFQDNNNKRYLCEIIKLKSKFLQFLVQKLQKVAKTKFFLSLYLPILPKQELQQFLFQATEMGVADFYFFESEYSRKIPAVIEKKKIIWQQILQRACENSGVECVPNIFFCGKLEKALQEVEKKNIPFCVLHPQASTTKQIPNHCSQLAVFVGPQKGFSVQELAKINTPFISLGKNWLKPQTAALSALAIFQHLFGEFQFSMNKK